MCSSAYLQAIYVAFLVVLMGVFAITLVVGSGYEVTGWTFLAILFVSGFTADLLVNCTSVGSFVKQY